MICLVTSSLIASKVRVRTMLLPRSICKVIVLDKVLVGDESDEGGVDHENVHEQVGDVPDVLGEVDDTIDEDLDHHPEVLEDDLDVVFTVQRMLNHTDVLLFKSKIYLKSMA